MEIGNIMGDKEIVLSRYSAFPEEKSFLYKCIGVMMRKSSHKQFVQKHLDMLFSTVKHSSQVEREVSCNLYTILMLMYVLVRAVPLELDSVLHHI